MGPDIDCPVCGAYRVRPGVEMCSVCETAHRLDLRITQLEAERDALRARVAELEAPPVVPEGWEVVGVPYQLDHDEYETRWELWVRDVDGGPITVAHVDRGNVCHPSGIDEPFAAFRALMWAAEHDAIPPHAGDEVPAIRGVCGDTCTSGNECGRIGCPECQQ